MAFASCGLWAWARDRPVAAGVLIGLGTAAKLYPVFLLVPIILLAIRTRHGREAGWCVAQRGRGLAGRQRAARRWPTTTAGGSSTRSASAATPRRARSGTWATTWPRSASTAATPPAWAPSGIAVAFLLLGALAAVAWLALLAPVKPRLGQLAFLAVLAFLLTTKVWSPQYSIWLVPLVALARPRWRLNLVWQFSEVGGLDRHPALAARLQPIARPRHRLRLADAGPADPRRVADRDRRAGHPRDLAPRTRHRPHRAPLDDPGRRPVRRRRRLSDRAAAVDDCEPAAQRLRWIDRVGSAPADQADRR